MAGAFPDRRLSTHDDLDCAMVGAHSCEFRILTFKSSVTGEQAKKNALKARGQTVWAGHSCSGRHVNFQRNRKTLRLSVR